MYVPFAFSGIGMSLKEISALLAVWPFLFLYRKRNGQTANNADISFRDIPIPENANGTYMQSTDDISIAKTARALQTASHAHIAA